MVAQFQEENMDGRLTGTREGFSNPNFQNLARAYGFTKVVKITSMSELEGLRHLLEDLNDEPIFLEFVVDPQAKALPKMSVKDE
jgi:thiamine pyrophosphate-dependent acetolactate synthase large subunit-like protein